MFYEIDSSLDALIAHPTPAFIDKLDIIFTAHRVGNIIFVPTRDQLKSFDNIDISNLSKKTARYISTRINDYRAAKAEVSRYISLCDDSVTTNYIIEVGRALVSHNYLDIFHLITQKFFLAEAHRDISFALTLTEAYLDMLRYPTSYVSVRPIQGGGSALCHALSMEQIAPCKGMMMCDRDTVDDPPPLKKNSTSAKAQATAMAMNLIDQSLGISPTSPFFASLLTWGYSIENLVGPHSLECYLSSLNRIAERAAIVSAFPNFPALNQSEWFFWRYLNLKSGTPNLKPVLDRFKKEIGPVPAAITGRLAQLASLSLPADAVDWLVTSYSFGRFRGALRTALQRDLNVPVYQSAVSAIAITAMAVCAGDKSAHRT